MKTATRTCLFLLSLFLLPGLSFGQNDDCEVFHHEINVMTNSTVPEHEIEQFEVNLHMFHESERACTNWYPTDEGTVRSLPARCRYGGPVHNTQGEVTCGLTAGPNGERGCTIVARLRCGGHNRSVSLTCNAQVDGRMPMATLEWDNTRLWCGNNDRTRTIQCSPLGSSLDYTSCFTQTGVCSTYTVP